MPDFEIRPAISGADIEAVAGLFRAYAASLPVDLAYQGFSTELATLPGAYAPPHGASSSPATPRKPQSAASLSAASPKPAAR